MTAYEKVNRSRWRYEQIPKSPKIGENQGWHLPTATGVSSMGIKEPLVDSINTWSTLECLPACALSFSQRWSDGTYRGFSQCYSSSSSTFILLLLKCRPLLWFSKPLDPEPNGLNSSLQRLLCRRFISSVVSPGFALMFGGFILTSCESTWPHSVSGITEPETPHLVI